MIGRIRPGLNTRLRLCLAALAVLSLPACSGPREPIDLTVKEFPSDVLLGKPDPDASPPRTVAQGVNLEPVGFPSFIQAPPPMAPRPSGDASPTTTTTEPVAVCAKTDPLRAPVYPATRTLSKPPAAQKLAFMNEGTYEYGAPAGANEKGAYPARTERTIEPGRLVGGGLQPAQANDGSFAFRVDESVNGQISSTTYLVDPAEALYLVSVTTTRPDGSTDQFSVANPRSLPILPLPVSPGEEFAGQGFDPTSQTSMTIKGIVGEKVRVDACGTPLDAWDVTVTGGVVAPNKQLEFSANYAIGTQYGGISLRDSVEISCPGRASVPCDSGRTVHSRNLATIAVQPRLTGATA